MKSGKNALQHFSEQDIISGFRASACQHSPQNHKDTSHTISSFTAQPRWSLRVASSRYSTKKQSLNLTYFSFGSCASSQFAYSSVHYNSFLSNGPQLILTSHLNIKPTSGKRCKCWHECLLDHLCKLPLHFMYNMVQCGAQSNLGLAFNHNQLRSQQGLTGKMEHSSGDAWSHIHLK